MNMNVMPQTEKEEADFYKKVLDILTKQEAPFLIGGTYAVKAYTNINRPTKDLDLFCKPSDYPKILKVLEEHGFEIEITDERWIAKAKYKEHFIDIIFSAIGVVFTINDAWIETAESAEMFGYTVKIPAPEYLIMSKIYRHERDHYDGNDVINILLKKASSLDWKKLLDVMDAHWELLFSTLLTFRFVYPSKRDVIPPWVIKELLQRVHDQLTLPTPQDKVCRGRLISLKQYEQAFNDWGFKDITELT